MSPEEENKHIVNSVQSFGFRYVVYIYFGKSPEHISEPVRTLKEAMSYKSMIDNTVRKACVIDRANAKIIEWWVS